MAPLKVLVPTGATTAAIAFFQTQPLAEINTNSVISLSVLVIVIGAVWKISSVLTRIELKLQTMEDQIRDYPRRQAHVENHLLTFEEDINNLWAAVRAGDDSGKLLEVTRRARFVPYSEGGK